MWVFIGDFIIGGIIGFIVVSLMFLPLIIVNTVTDNQFKHACKAIQVGMAKNTVIAILGKNYIKNVSSNGIEIYEWSIWNGPSICVYFENEVVVSYIKGE